MSPIQKAQQVANAQSILGVGPNATELELRRAWKKLAFDMHPDRGTGSSEELANINAAYSLLREKRVLSRQINDGQPFASPQPGNTQAKGVRPKRPVSRNMQASLAAKSTDLSAGVMQACRAVIGLDGTPSHIPTRIERRGTEMTYVVRTRLSEGTNRVVLPLSATMVRRDAPQVLTFRASSEGRGTLNVPESIVTRLFPGISTVKIAFGRD